MSNQQYPYRYWLPWWLLFTVTALSFALWTPPFQYPDEPTHLAGCLESTNPARREVAEGQILQIMDTHRFWQLAGAEAPQTMPSKFYQAPLLRKTPTQFAKPMLYYWTTGKVLNRLNITEIISSLFALRLLGVLIASFSALIFGFICRNVLPDSPWQAVAISCLAIPQFSYMAGAANPSNLAWVSGSILLLSAIWLLKPDQRVAGWILLFTGIAVTMATHRAGLVVLPAVVFALFIGRFRLERHHIPWIVWPVLGWVSALGSLLVAWKRPLVVKIVLSRFVNTLDQLQVSVADNVFTTDWVGDFWVAFARSTVMNFGWLSLSGPVWIYWFWGVIGFIALIGWGVRLVNRKKSVFPVERWQSGVLWSAFLVMLWAGAGQYFVQKSLSQGRYLFAVWPAIGCLIAIGWSSLVPRIYTRFAVSVLVAGIWATTLFSLWRVLISGFYF